MIFTKKHALVSIKIQPLIIFFGNSIALSKSKDQAIPHKTKPVPNAF